MFHLLDVRCKKQTFSKTWGKPAARRRFARIERKKWEWGGYFPSRDIYGAYSIFQNEKKFFLKKKKKFGHIKKYVYLCGVKICVLTRFLCLGV